MLRARTTPGIQLQSAVRRLLSVTTSRDKKCSYNGPCIGGQTPCCNEYAGKHMKCYYLITEISNPIIDPSPFNHVAPRPPRNLTAVGHRSAITERNHVVALTAPVAACAAQLRSDEAMQCGMGLVPLEDCELRAKSGCFESKFVAWRKRARG